MSLVVSGRVEHVGAMRRVAANKDVCEDIRVVQSDGSTKRIGPVAVPAQIKFELSESLGKLAHLHVLKETIVGLQFGTKAYLIVPNERTLNAARAGKWFMWFCVLVCLTGVGAIFGIPGLILGYLQFNQNWSTVSGLNDFRARAEPHYKAQGISVETIPW